MDPCYFCEIVAGRTDQWNVLERTDLTMTVLNGRQYEIGQCMVVPLRHAPTVLDLNAREDAAVMAAARRLARGIVSAFAPEGLLLYQNNGVGSAQEVPHFHLHVVPRRARSSWGGGPPHLAALAAPARTPEQDHTVVTDAKRRTAALLRGHL
jgi:diadenosine tetraphosphate (Ap4A) HIT family hydrolase